MKSCYYPKADRETQWWEDKFDRGVFKTIEKIMLHTTETTGWPSYQSGAIAPTLTYKPATREWRQHNFLDTSARALGDPASTPVRENRDNVIQIEIIWYSKDIDKLPATAYQDLAEFVAYVRKEWGGPALVGARNGGPNDDVHLTSAQYDAFRGILGHANAPKPSTHWDPGKFDYKKLIALVKKLETPVTDSGTAAPTPAPVVDQTKQAADIANPSVRSIWQWDGIPSPATEQAKGNKFWAASTYIKWGFEHGVTTLKRLDALEAKLDEILTLLKSKA